MFDQIIIDEKNKFMLTKAIDYNRINHCYIFVGPEGTNKRKTAIEFSKAILCSVNNEPCNHCISCNKMDSGNHPDFLEIFPLESSIKINQIREMQKKMNVKSYEGDKKVFIINNSETMGIAAQNSLLKTLEEPNAGVYIILISESKERILSTILSRGQILYFNPLDKQTFESSLTKKYILKEDFLNHVYELSQGCIEKAENIIKNPQEIDQFKIFRKYIISIMKSDYSQIFEFSKWIKDEKLSNEYVINNLLIIFKNALYAKVDGDLNIYKEISECLTYGGFHDIIGNIITLQGNLKYNVNFQLQIERLLLRIQEEKLINDKGHRNTV